MRKRLLALFLALCLLLPLAPAALAADPRSELNTLTGFYAKQQTSSTCTLASAAMMMRRRAYIDGLEDWDSLTESRLRRVAWSYVGLSHEFTMDGITVLYGTFARDRSAEEQLRELLAGHPEGVVVYDRSKPHAILITDYTDGVFYCSDPSTAAPSGRYPVSSATISLSNVRAYWYVAADTNRPQGVGGSLTATGLLYPSRLQKGTAFALAGALTSPGLIQQVRVSLQTDGGTEVQAALAEPGSYTYDLADLAGQLDFSALNAGSYTLLLTSDDEYGARISLRKPLLVGNGETQTALYSGAAPVLANINAVNLVETGFDVECSATDPDGGMVSVLYAAWADGEQFAPNLIADRSGDLFTAHVDADAALLGIDSMLINITAMDADGNSCRGALLVKVSVDDSDIDNGPDDLVADLKIM